MAWRRASLASLVDLRSSASILRLVAGSVEAGVVDSSLLHWGQRLAKPGLSGFSSNSSLQMAQVLMGKGISTPGIVHSWLALTPPCRPGFWRRSRPRFIVNFIVAGA
jgi:hypothetical protein